MYKYSRSTEIKGIQSSLDAPLRPRSARPVPPGVVLGAARLRAPRGATVSACRDAPGWDYGVSSPVAIASLSTGSTAGPT